MYFCLKPDYTTSWVDDQSKEESTSTWKKQYKYRKWNIRITFVSYNTNQLQYIFEQQSNSNPIMNLSLIKSNTQKTFRRGEVDKCLSSFKVFCQINYKSALKRLVIIILEDGYYDQWCNGLIWLQICSNFFDYKLTKQDFCYLASLIQYQCQIKYKMSLSSIWSTNLTNIILNKVLEEQNITKRTMFLSLLLYNDKNIFKLAGDKILGYYTIYRNMLVQLEELNQNFEYIDFDKIPYLPYNKLNIASCDFHVDPQLIPLVINQLNSLQITAKVLKKAIWYMSSRCNIRYEINLSPIEIISNSEKEAKIMNKYGTLWENIKAICYKTMLSRMLQIYKTPTVYTKNKV